jgi:hypothetical protein
MPSQEATPLDASAPRDTVQAESSEVSAPEAEAPKAEAAPEPEAPEAKAPETEAPEAETPETGTAETETPQTEEPAAEAPDAEAPEAPDAETPEASDVEVPEAPDAEVPEQAAAVSDPAAPEPDADTPAAAPRPRRWRRVLGGWREKYPVAARVLAWTTTVVALAVVVAALLMPDRIESVKPSTFMRLPVEAIFGAAVMIVLPRRPRIIVAVLAGLSLGALTVLNLLDIGFNEYLGRGFNVVLDWSLFSDARSYVQDTFGKTGALLALVGVVVLVLVLLTLTTLSVVRLANLLGRHTVTATRTTLVAGTVWVACAALGVQLTGVPLASEHTAAEIQDRAQAVRATLRDEAAFRKIAKKDDFADTPPDQLLTGLRGKDMMITFIESYGRSAIEDPVMAPGVDATLTAENEKLTQAGFAAKSGWLTSATYGGGSWLGHSTFMSGLWISNQQRYRTVTAGERLTLPGAFKKTGAWDTVGVMPGVQKAWPEQKFYGIDKLYDSHKLGYKGPKFSWSTMPDQYALTAFERLVHSKKHDKPLMSTIILTSSHQPWAPIPKLVPQDQVGDGSIYDSIEKAGKKPADIITDSTKSKQEYGKSIQYSVSSLINYLVKYGNKNTVLIFLGDHQPIARVSGNHASRDVPVSIVAKDPKVLDKIADWNWADGLQPKQDTPVWKMNAFRDRFLTAYGSTPTP